MFLGHNISRTRNLLKISNFYSVSGFNGPLKQLCNIILIILLISFDTRIQTKDLKYFSLFGARRPELLPLVCLCLLRIHKKVQEVAIKWLGAPNIDLTMGMAKAIYKNCR